MISQLKSLFYVLEFQKKRKNIPFWVIHMQSETMESIFYLLTAFHEILIPKQSKKYVNIFSNGIFSSSCSLIHFNTFFLYFLFFSTKRDWKTCNEFWKSAADNRNEMIAFFYTKRYPRFHLVLKKIKTKEKFCQCLLNLYTFF